MKFIFQSKYYCEVWSTINSCNSVIINFILENILRLHFIFHIVTETKMFLFFPYQAEFPKNLSNSIFKIGMINGGGGDILIATFFLYKK